MSAINNIPNLSAIDPEMNLPSQVNFDYYTTHQFHSSSNIQNTLLQKSLSLLHCNIRSIRATFDRLDQFLSELNYPFDIIGISETWINDNTNQLVNIDLSGRPDVLYFLPEILETRDYRTAVCEEDMEVAEELCCGRWPNCSEEFPEMVQIIMNEHGLTVPQNTEEATLLYSELLHHINDI